MIKIRQKSTTTYPINFLMVDATDHVTGKTGLTPTVTLSKNGAAFAAAAGAVTEISSGWYSLAGNATDRNTLGELLVHATATGADPFDIQYAIVDYDPFAAIGAIQADYARRTGDYAPIGEYDTQLDANISTRAPADEYDIELAAIQADLDDPDQYKVDVSALATTTHLQEVEDKADAIKAKTDTILPCAGIGAIEWNYNLKDNAGNPIADADIWVTTDEAGANVIASGKTDQFGNVKFYLDAGTVYVWGQKSGYDFTNPDKEEVTE